MYSVASTFIELQFFHVYAFVGTESGPNRISTRQDRSLRANQLARKFGKPGLFITFDGGCALPTAPSGNETGTRDSASRLKEQRVLRTPISCNWRKLKEWICPEFQFWVPWYSQQQAQVRRDSD